MAAPSALVNHYFVEYVIAPVYGISVCCDSRIEIVRFYNIRRIGNVFSIAATAFFFICCGEWIVHAFTYYLTVTTTATSRIDWIYCCCCFLGLSRR